VCSSDLVGGYPVEPRPLFDARVAAFRDWLRARPETTIAVVVFESWLGWVCPLTTLENHLRRQAGQTVDDVSFIGRWARDVLFFQGEPWVFTLIYSLFGVAVVATLIFGCPRRPWGNCPTS